MGRFVLSQGCFKGKRILVGVTGGIAAYKTLSFISLLRQAGCDVRVVLTEAATRFVTREAIAAAGGVKVYQDVFSLEEGSVLHVALADWADEVIVMPATAHFLSKMAHGLSDDLLSLVYLSTQTKVSVVPAMESRMWLHPSTTQNVALLRKVGVRFLGPTEGRLASGGNGLGRMLEPQAVWQAMCGTKSLMGVKALVTLGPTREWLDPVRYLSNASSGQMGLSIVAALQNEGAEVLVIAGPVDLPLPEGSIRVETAREMYEAVKVHWAEAQLGFAVAAVSDYMPVEVAPHKIKKSSDAETMVLTLTKAPDILAYMGQTKGDRILIGFAAETTDVLRYGQEKRLKKKADLLVANVVGQPHLGFAAKESKAYFIHRDHTEELPVLSKVEVARRLIDEVIELRRGQHDC